MQPRERAIEVALLHTLLEWLLKLITRVGSSGNLFRC